MKNNSKAISFIYANPIVVLLFLSFFSIALGFTEFYAPISGDTSIYAYYGREIVHGQILYRDLWDFKSPGTYYLFALLFRIFPDSVTTLRLSAIGVNIFSSWMFFRIGQIYFRSGSALVGSAILLIVTNLGGFLNQNGPFPETFIPLVGLLGFYFFARSFEDKYNNKLIYSGIFAGLLIVLKQTSLSFAGSILLFLFIDIFRFGWRKVRHLLLFVVGIAIAISPWLLDFHLETTWVDFVRSVILYPFSYPASTPLRAALQNLLMLSSSSMVSLGIVFLLTGTVVLVAIRTRNQIQPGIKIALLWLVIGMMLISLPCRFYVRDLMVILAPVVTLATSAINELFYSATSVTNQAVLRLLGFSLGGFFIFGTVVQQAPRTLHILDDRILHYTPTRSEVLAGYSWFSAPDVKVFAWGDPRIPYVAGVHSGIKWLDVDPFFNQTYVTDEVIDEIMRELESNRPQYFVETSARPLLRESYLKGTRVNEYINENYEFLIQVGDASIYKYKVTH